MRNPYADQITKSTPKAEAALAEFEAERKAAKMAQGQADKDSVQAYAAQMAAKKAAWAAKGDALQARIDATRLANAAR
jgi:hypothetical protein